MTSETYLVTVVETTKGRAVERHPIPHKEKAVALARQHYEDLSDRALSDVLKDLKHEQHRRAGTLAVLGGWDPEHAQHRGSTT